MLIVSAHQVFRMFKLTRHFEASKVLTETAKKVVKQILGMLALLAFFVTLFAIFLFQVEGGTPCFVGDVGCIPPEAVANTVHIGDRILVNKQGDVSQFGNVFFGIWFSFVTITTTGYGDVLPVTNIGQVMAIFLMISGTFYMAMPLTAAASTFYQVHEKYQIKHRNVEVAPVEDKKEEANRTPAVFASVPGTSAINSAAFEDIMDVRLRMSIKALLAELFMSSSAVTETFKEMQEPLPESHGGHQVAKHSSRKQSTLLKNINRQISNLDRCLSGCERDLLSLVTLYNSYMKNVLDGHAASTTLSIDTAPDRKKSKSGGDRKRSTESDDGGFLSQSSSRKSSGQ